MSALRLFGHDRRDDRPGQRGQILVLFVLMLGVMLGAAGLVIDIGGSWGQERTQQKVADVASMAGAVAAANGALRPEIIQKAIDAAVSNGFLATEVTVNIPPTSGPYAPGGSRSGPLSTNDCATLEARPCWIEVGINRPHQNSFAQVFGMNSFPVSSRGVSVAGIANSVTNGIAPLMFNYRAVQATDREADKNYCSPQTVHCSPASTFPLNETQFNFTTYCVNHPESCNVDANTAKQIVVGGNFQVEVNLDMFLGPHNSGNPNSVCQALLDTYPTGADIPVAISDDNGNMVGFWIWHFDPSGTDCTGNTTISGWFVDDITDQLPLTVNAGSSAATFGQHIANLVE